MAKPTAPYRDVVVESFSGGGSVHIRPIAGQMFSPTIRVECSRELTDLNKYPLGTKFKIRAKLTDRESDGEFLYSSYKWPFIVM